MELKGQLHIATVPMVDGRSLKTLNETTKGHLR